MINLQQALAKASDCLKNYAHPNLEAQYLLCAVLQKNRAFLLAFPEKNLTDQQTATFEHYLQRRIQGEPLAYITGYKEFWSLPFIVTPDVLIPRPETELLVETVLSVCREKKNCSLVDLGTGSGAIALALASERPDWDVVATDVSDAALKLAHKNAKNLKLNHVNFKQGNWYQALNNQQFDVIVSNPPYIAIDDTALDVAVSQFEPNTALIAQHDGLADLQQIIINAGNHLVNDGYLFLEHGYQQADAVAMLMQQHSFVDIVSVNDLQGHVRVTYAKKK